MCAPPRNQALEEYIKGQGYELQLLRKDLEANDAQLQRRTELTQVYDMYSDMETHEVEDIKNPVSHWLHGCSNR